jgi:hypothetical protein
MRNHNCPSNDPKKSRLVWALSPNTEGHYDRLIVSHETFQAYKESGCSYKIGEYLGLIHGNFGEDINVEGTTGLLNPTAIFKGLRRPMRNNNSSQDIYIFVTNPDRNYGFPEKNAFSSVGPTREEVPRNSVFLTYVEYNLEIVETIKLRSGYTANDLIAGVIHSWEWVFACDKNPNLPASHNDGRFISRIL